MLIKNDNRTVFSLSEDKKSQRQEEPRKKIFRPNQGLLTKMMILTLALAKYTSAKNIDGLILKNEIRHEHVPGSYGINHDKNHGDKIAS